MDPRTVPYAVLGVLHIFKDAIFGRSDVIFNVSIGITYLVIYLVHSMLHHKSYKVE